jgi:hypothetical protein
VGCFGGKLTKRLSIFILFIVHGFTYPVFMNSNSVGFYYRRNINTSTNDSLNLIKQGDYYVDKTSSYGNAFRFRSNNVRNEQIICFIVRTRELRLPLSF